MPGIASAATSVALALRRLADEDDPHRRRRDHASQPRAAGHRRAVRHARGAVSRAAIDLGLGRAPGTDQAAPTRCAATSRPTPTSSRSDVVELMNYFKRRDRPRPRDPRRGARHSDLDSRLEPVRRAARGDARPALRLRLAFRAADDDGGDRRLSRAVPAVRAARQALRHARLQRLRRRHRRGGASCSSTSMQQAFVALRSGKPEQLPPPQAGYAESLPLQARAMLERVLSCSAIGSPETVAPADRCVRRAHRRRRVMITSQIFDPAARIRSYELLMDAVRQPEPSPA